ncbi:MAG: bifunctional phosphopantothenoylcysteine decarboxylase/phosphopantothenate--cysteine ligase CoaBC [Firmicutes bacterium]|nr:bifunctional phosphopantothenoylcysteine decarboxylase/phosphopantothenate--cysteine ligase CoaBC [Bacillota bacterium]
MFKGKKITAGISGGIAAYKAAELVSWMKQNGAEVSVAMTKNATEFITPLTLKALSGRPVAVDIMDTSSDWHVPHVDLAACDLLLLAPATANLLAKAAHGLADDLLSATILASRAPVLCAPAMHTDMYNNPSTQENLRILQERGWSFIDPGWGRLACGAMGQGRLADVAEIKEAIRAALSEGPLKGKRVLVTAGPTYEYIDPVRFVGNRSSGKMGFAMAEAAHAAGAEVVLVAGPTTLADPPGIRVEHVVSAQEMYDAVWREYANSDIVIMAAAVSDYRPDHMEACKMKKGGEQSLQLVRTQDILASLGEKKGEHFLVGFAAETNDLLAYAQDKLERKHLDMIVANDVSQAGAGFDGDTNIVTALYPRDGQLLRRDYPLQTKKAAARQIIELISALLPPSEENKI